MDRDLNDKIFSLRPSLSRQFRKVANCILQNGTESCFLIARELASAAGVSPSTIVRFSRKLGYKGFHSFKAALQDKIRMSLSSSQRVSKTVQSFQTRDLLKQTFEQDRALIENTLRLISERDFNRAVEKVQRSATVYLLGEKSSFALAYFLYFRLSRLGVNCKLIHFGGPAVFSELAPMKKGDLLLAIGFRMIPYEVCGAVKIARDKKVTVIAITSPPVSPISVPADIVLFVDRGGEDKVQSVTAGFALCHAIIIGVAARIGKRSRALLKRIDALERAEVKFTPEDWQSEMILR